MASDFDKVVRVSPAQYRSIRAWVVEEVGVPYADPETGLMLFTGIPIKLDPELTAPAFEAVHHAALWVLGQRADAMRARERIFSLAKW